MIERSISSTLDSRYHRARCPVCTVTCEQRRCSVRVSEGDIRQALACVECEMIYLDADPVALPDGWIVDARAAHMLEAYAHSSGARVQRFATDSANCWAWYTPSASYGSKCYTPATSMLDAMTAALASELSAAELHARLEREYGCTNCTLDRGSRECAESGHYYCNASKVAAEPARGEP